MNHIIIVIIIAIDFMFKVSIKVIIFEEIINLIHRR